MSIYIARMGMQATYTSARPLLVSSISQNGPINKQIHHEVAEECARARIHGLYNFPTIVCTWDVRVGISGAVAENSLSYVWLSDARAYPLKYYTCIHLLPSLNLINTVYNNIHSNSI